MVFDKTGTLTKGRFTVSQLLPVHGSSADLLKLAALAEQASPHPIAKALVQAANASGARPALKNWLAGDQGDLPGQVLWSGMPS